MYFSKTALLSLAILCMHATAVAVGASDDLCRPFRVHMQAELPSRPPISSNDLKSCLEHYEKLDFDQDGIKDWTSNVDGKSGDTLYPLDPDLDGDGIENVLDISPLNARVPANPVSKDLLPDHLRMSGTRGQIQKDLFARHGILAIDHTDQHSIEVLGALLLIFERGLPQSTKNDLISFRYLYAFKGHDPLLNIAGYHRHMQSISIGGISAYGTNTLSEARKVSIVASLAHEIGHAFLFDKMTPQELYDLGQKHGKWSHSEDRVSSFFDRPFFQSHPFKALARKKRKKSKMEDELISESLWQESNFASEYSAKNMHEWFADAFAAGILNRLAEKGHLGADWKKHFAQVPQHRNGYWVNYNNISKDFRKWLDQRLDGDQTNTSLRNPSGRPLSNNPNSLRK